MTAVPGSADGQVSRPEVSVSIDLTFVSAEALLSACHWFSQEFVCDLRRNNDAAEVILVPRNPAAPFDPDSVRDAFMTSAIDFALRERIEAKTSDVRDVLLAKAFSESGVLEDNPEGILGDSIEEAKTDSLFKILSSTKA